MKESKSTMFEPKATSGQLILISKMITDKRLGSSKETIISELTGGRTENFRELYVNEATDVIRYLKEAARQALAAEASLS